jgi:Tfp pilus assembly protein PilW
MLSHLRQERGFTLMELLVASMMTVVVLGGAVALTAQIQNGYRRQIEDSAGEQEARYALEWIGRYLRGAGNNPFNVTTSNCPSAATLFRGLIINNANSITLQSDSNPPDALVGGASPACDQTNEHVTISFNNTDHTITFLDNAVGASATTRTDAVIDNLRFVFLDSARVETAVAADVYYVRTEIRIRTRTIDGTAGTFNTRTLSSEVRVRGR